MTQIYKGNIVNACTIMKLDGFSQYNNLDPEDYYHSNEGLYCVH